MAQWSGFFNAEELSPGVYDRVYNVSDWANFFASFMSNGVFPINNQTGLAVTPASSGLSVTVAPGTAFINGYTYINSDPEVCTLATANPTLGRIDTVILELSMSNREITLQIVTGTPAESPTASALTQTDSVYQIQLASINVPPGATNLTSTSVTSTIADPTLCGWASATGTETLQLAQILTQLQTIQGNLVNGIPTLAVNTTSENADLLCDIYSWVFNVNSTSKLKIYATEICLQGGEMQNLTYPIAFTTCAIPLLTPSGVKAIGGGWEVPGSATNYLYGKGAAIPGSSTTGCMIINPNPNPGAFFFVVIGY